MVALPVIDFPAGIFLIRSHDIKNARKAPRWSSLFQPCRVENARGLSWSACSFSFSAIGTDTGASKNFGAAQAVSDSARTAIIAAGLIKTAGSDKRPVGIARTGVTRECPKVDYLINAAVVAFDYSAVFVA